MEPKLPTYKISISPELSEDGEHLGIDEVALTSTPAIILKGLAFDNVKSLRFTDELKYRLAAPALIPNMLIYRQDDELGEYNVMFDELTIEQLVEDFMMNKKNIVFNLDHTDSKSPAYILESWITGDPKTDKSFTQYGVECPKGSFFIVSQFTDKEYFKTEIIEKGRTGYSIEGFLGLALESIKSKLKSNKMKETKLQMPDGEYPMADGSTMVIKDGICEMLAKVEDVVDPKKVPCEETPVAPVAMVDAPVDPAAPVDAPVDAPKEATIDEAAVLAIIQPKLDELYKVIAEIKTLIETDNAEDTTEDVVSEPSKMSKGVQALMGFMEATKS